MTAVRPFSNEHNPVLRSEFAYQRFVIQRSRSGWLWIGLALLLVAPALIFAIGYTGQALLGWTITISFYDLIDTWHLALGGVLLIANASMYPVVTLVTLALARGSIAREKDQHTWDLLRLTRLHPRQILLGKWWASLRALNGDHGMVIVLRVGLLAYWITVILAGDHGLDGTTAPYRLYFLLLMPLIVLQALADSALTAMLGVVSAVPDGVWRTTAEFTASMIRLMCAIAVALWFWFTLQATFDGLRGALLLAVVGVLVTVALTLLTLWVGQHLVRRV